MDLYLIPIAVIKITWRCSCSRNVSPLCSRPRWCRPGKPRARPPAPWDRVQYFHTPLCIRNGHLPCGCPHISFVYICIVDHSPSDEDMTFPIFIKNLTLQWDESVGLRELPEINFWCCGLIWIKLLLWSIPKANRIKKYGKFIPHQLLPGQGTRAVPLNSVQE